MASNGLWVDYLLGLQATQGIFRLGRGPHLELLVAPSTILLDRLEALFRNTRVPFPFWLVLFGLG